MFKPMSQRCRLGARRSSGLAGRRQYEGSFLSGLPPVVPVRALGYDSPSPEVQGPFEQADVQWPDLAMRLKPAGLIDPNCHLIGEARSMLYSSSPVIFFTSQRNSLKEAANVNVSVHRSLKRTRRSLWSQAMILSLIVVCSVDILVEPVFAQQSSRASNVPVSSNEASPSGVGIQAGSALATIIYFPLKLAYAIGGGVVGGLGYGFSGGSEQTAKNIWIPSIYGTYLITPDHLKGDKPIRFLGVPAESPREAVDYAPQEPAPLPLEPIR